MSPAGYLGGVGPHPVLALELGWGFEGILASACPKCKEHFLNTIERFSSFQSNTCSLLRTCEMQGKNTI